MKTKKELKKAYKQHKPQMGVYQIKNKVNGKIFIEGSTDIPSKWNRHKIELKFGSHRNRDLQKDWNELREESFEFSILSELKFNEEVEVNYTKEVKALEDMVIEELNINNEMRY